MNRNIKTCLLSITLFFWALVCWSRVISYGRDRKISFAKQVKEGKSFKGDCDDFAYTIRDLLIEKGHAVQTVIVRTPKVSGSILHMVVKVDNEYMIDNRYPFVRFWKDGVKGSQYKVLTFGELRKLIHK